MKTRINSAKRSPSSALLQRKCACGSRTSATGQCTKCAKEDSRQNLLRKSTSDRDVGGVPPIVHDVLRSPGQPLDRETLAFFEPRFGHDFSRVRVHADERAGNSARDVNARAYTVGRNIAFGFGEYTPDSSEGKRLPAHELTHVVQQGASFAVPTSLTIGPSNSLAEAQADAVGTNILVPF